LKGLLKDEQKKTKQLEEQVNTSSQPMQQLEVEEMDKELAPEKVKVDAAVLTDQKTRSGKILKQKRLSTIP
jgi:hypothetical protein